MIPIENIYYMLSYSVGVLPPIGEKRVHLSGRTTLVEWFARALARALKPITKRGLYKTYVSNVEATSMPHGRIQMKETMRYAGKPTVVSAYDEFSIDQLYNQIIRYTLHRLIQDATLSPDTVQRLKGYMRYFRQVQRIDVTPQHFQQLHFHKYNERYRTALSICQLICTYAMIDERSGKLQFIDFERTQMHALFESFVRNFYKLHLKRYHVSREYIRWNVKEVYEGNASLMPKMYTDMSITNDDMKMIIDTKYYEQTFQQNFSVDKIRSPHLYQLYSYLSNAQKRPIMCGMLLYPQVTEPLTLKLQIDDYDITIATVDLAAHWTSIENRLLTLFHEKMDRA
ncbi:5-methylcytosine restriction system specificity protein McrC [Kurthia massiliensis]|uniref:5-methylcytosine restriction system specificity protein McrC n=1 Tax=Kurthia massiliensis TaxID=1033739 RepID=UPI000289EE64|nr:5-methylcytosine-specific restriction enzyme subunit McrC [Kurthia massiliensis]